jgi:hypothetical protein
MRCDGVPPLWCNLDMMFEVLRVLGDASIAVASDPPPEGCHPLSGRQ